MYKVEQPSYRGSAAPPGLLSTSDEEESSLNSSILSAEPALFRSLVPITTTTTTERRALASINDPNIQQLWVDDVLDGNCVMCASATYEQPKRILEAPPPTPDVQRASDDQFLRPKQTIPIPTKTTTSKIDVAPQTKVKRRSMFQRALGKKQSKKETKQEERISLLSRAICKPRRKSRSLSRPRSSHTSDQKTVPPVNPKFHRDMNEFIEVSATPNQLARVKDLKDIANEPKEIPAPLGEQAIQLLRTASLVDNDSTFANDETVSQITTENIWSMAQCTTQLCHAAALPPQRITYNLNRNHQSAPSAPLHRSTSHAHKNRMAEKVSRRVRSQQGTQRSIDTGILDPMPRTGREKELKRGVFRDRDFQRPRYQDDGDESSSSSDDDDSEPSRQQRATRSRPSRQVASSSQSADSRRNNGRRGSSQNRSKSVGRNTATPPLNNRIHDLNAFLNEEMTKERPSSKDVTKERQSMNHRKKDDILSSEEFVISGIHRVASDIERNRRQKHHRPLPAQRIERPKSRAEILVAESLERPGWMGNSSALPAEKERRSGFATVNPNDIAGVLEDIARPRSAEHRDNSVLLNNSFINKRLQSSKKEDKSWLEDNIDLDSAAFEKFETDSIFSDLKTETGTNVDLDTSFDAASRHSKYSHFSKKSMISGITNFTEGSASVDFHGCFA